jgi:hypothetical protein
MPIVRVFLFTTLVLTSATFTGQTCRAAKTSDYSIGSEPSIEDAQTTPAAPGAEKTTVDISIPPPQRPNTVRATEYFYPFRSALSVRFGKSTRSTTYIEGATTTPSVTGVQYFFLADNLRRFEAGADLNSDGTGTLQFTERWVFSRAKLRPYGKAGLGLVIVPRDQLATFAKFSQYLAVGAAGAEYLVRKSQSVRAEVEAGLSLSGFYTVLTAGYVWAW